LRIYRSSTVLDLRGLKESEEGGCGSMLLMEREKSFLRNGRSRLIRLIIIKLHNTLLNSHLLERDQGKYNNEREDLKYIITLSITLSINLLYLPKSIFIPKQGIFAKDPKYAKPESY